MMKWEGVIPALTTKLTASHELDLPLFKKNIQEQMRDKIK
jgi:4-hydroxy-tetrahydrodipicolinate synthase